MSARQQWPPSGQPWQRRPELRIGDAERERAASQLAEHYAVGRLTQDEHAERLDQVWAARTQAELDPVFADLPGHATAPPRPAVGPTRPRRRGGLPPLLAVLLAVAALVAANLPLVLVALGVWFFFLRGSCGARSWGRVPRRW